MLVLFNQWFKTQRYSVGNLAKTNKISKSLYLRSKLGILPNLKNDIIILSNVLRPEHFLNCTSEDVQFKLHTQAVKSN